MADEITQPAVGQQVVGTVTSNGSLPGKKDFMTGLASYAVTGSIKWYETHYGVNIPAVWEVIILTFAVTLASYCTPERFKSGARPTARDIVTAIATALCSSAIKGFEDYTQSDVPAEYEAIINGIVVGFASGFVPSKNVVFTNAIVQPPPKAI